MHTTNGTLTRDISFVLVQAGIDHNNGPGKAFQFDFEGKSIRGIIGTLYIDEHSNIEIPVSNFPVIDFKRFTKLKWENSSTGRVWKLYYEKAGELQGLKYIPGEFTLL